MWEPSNIPYLQSRYSTYEMEFIQHAEAIQHSISTFQTLIICNQIVDFGGGLWCSLCRDSLCMSLAMQTLSGWCGRGCCASCCNSITYLGFVSAARRWLHVWGNGLRVVLRENIRCDVG